MTSNKQVLDKKDNFKTKSTAIKSFLTCFFPLLLSFVFMMGVTISFTIIVGMITSGYYDDIDAYKAASLDILTSANVMLLMQICWASINLFVFRFWYIKKHAPSDRQNAHKIKSGYNKARIIKEGVVLCTATMMMFLIISIIATFINKYLPQLMGGYEEIANYKLSLGLFIYTVILAPLSEEFLFRGVIQSVAKKGMSTKAAVIIQAVFFAIIHGNLIQGVYAFVMGIFLGQVKERYQSIAVPILLHMLFNVTNFIPLKITFPIITVLTIMSIYFVNIDKSSLSK